MRLFTKIAAGVLLGIGLPIVLGMASELANPKSTNREGAIAALCFFGIPPTALGSWLVFGGRRRSEQEEHDRLQSTFFKLLKQGDGRITALGFAMETGLTGAMAKAYLDERAEEFTANFDVDEEGNMSYRFNLGGISLPHSGGKVQPRASLLQQQQSGAGQPMAAQGNFDVILEVVHSGHKTAAIKIVRELTGLELAEAKELVEATPTMLCSGVSAAIAQKCKQKLEAIGVTVMVIEN